MSADVLDVLRAAEQAAFKAYCETPASHPLVHVRADAWKRALDRLYAELGARARLARRAA